jgi:hypothetical protein
MQREIFPDDKPGLVAFSEGADEIDRGIGQSQHPQKDHFGLAGSVFEDEGEDKACNDGQT